jgi:hypothetical protein
MNKIIFGTIILSILSGCATVSEYNQGCRDGIDEASKNPSGFLDVDARQRDELCNKLDDLHKYEKKIGKTR